MKALYSTQHIGRKVKELFHDYHLTDYNIVQATEINQAYLSKVYTSRSVQPWQLKRLLYKVNREFNLNISTDEIFN